MSELNKGKKKREIDRNKRNTDKCTKKRQRQDMSIENSEEDEVKLHFSQYDKMIERKREMKIIRRENERICQQKILPDVGR